MVPGHIGFREIGMSLKGCKQLIPSAVLTSSLLIAGASHPASGQASIDPSQMKLLGEVGPRYVSYNVEAVEVTGGRFWAPYKSLPKTAEAKPAFETSGARDMNSRFQYRPPINLANTRLRKLAAALAPSYIRVSGTWRNSTYFQDNDGPALKTPPPGFQDVMTRAEWKGVVDFAHAVNAEIVSSVTTSMGVRDSAGAWTDTQAKAWFDYTNSIGGHIAAMEFMNEPTLMGLGRVPAGYGAKAYGQDSRKFGEFLRKESPGTLYLGPSSAAEGVPQGPPPHLIPTADLMQATGPIFDGFSYHVYYGRSHRCSGPNGEDVNDVLDPDWLNRGSGAEAFYARLRDKYLPGKPMWVTETGEASCGGDTWASDFIDSFRMLDQLGSLAQKSVQSVMFNTLASSDYGLIDQETLRPRPNYWAALLWDRTMGRRSLDPGIAPSSNLRVYAQCLKNTKGGVAVLVLDVDKAAAHTMKLPLSAVRYTLSSPDLLSTQVQLNGKNLEVAADGSVPEFAGSKVKRGDVSFAPATITVLAFGTAGNKSCERP